MEFLLIFNFPCFLWFFLNINVKLRFKKEYFLGCIIKKNKVPLDHTSYYEVIDVHRK
jgi:hypothetical protein